MSDLFSLPLGELVVNPMARAFVPLADQQSDYWRDFDDATTSPESKGICRIFVYLTIIKAMLNARCEDTVRRLREMTDTSHAAVYVEHLDELLPAFNTALTKFIPHVHEPYNEHHETYQRMFAMLIGMLNMAERLFNPEKQDANIREYFRCS